MADLGNLYFDILLRDKTDADIDKIKKKLEKVGVKIGADVDRKTFEANIKAALKNKTFNVNLAAGKNIKKAAIEANKTILTKSITDALKGKSFSADLKLVVRTATVQDAIRQAFAKAGMNYNTTASDVRAQRIAEIQQRMALRAANAQRNLGNAYRYSATGANESARASVVFGRSLHTNIRLAGELGSTIGNFASVFGIKDLLQDIVRIGGQLENQRIALGAILQDGGKATEMFSKIQALAVKSPFGIMDLNQYTKQLSAYSIPYNELYDTMKRLADISAGVGVDMGRIILAFGQVRAAGFLKGTELRQFTEANIPMVDKLAERFSNLEKRIVSAGEVYDMISKKKVTFEDVKAVLWDLTGEGGMFNNMQEVLSESLASKWKNLADAIDVMYGKIADGGIGSGLKSLAEFLTTLTQNWKYLSTAILSATTSYIAYKAAVVLGGRQMAITKGVYGDMLANKQREAAALRMESTYRKLSKAELLLVNTSNALTNADIKQAVTLGTLNKQQALRLIALGKIDKAMLRGVQRTLQISNAEIKMAQSATWGARATMVLGNAFRSLGLALKGLFMNPMTWVFAGITAITELFTYYTKKQDEIDERNKNFAESAKGSAETLERELSKIKDLDIAKLNSDEMKVKVKEFTTIIQNEADGWQSILSEIFAKEADGTFKNSVEEQLKMLKTKMEELADAKKKLMGDGESYSDVIGSTESGVLWWEKDIVDRIKAYSEAVEGNDKRLKELAIHARDVSTAIGLATAGNKELSKSLEGKNLNDQVALLKDYETEWGKFIVELTKSNSDAAQIVNEWYNNIEKYFVKGKESEMLWDFSKAKEAMINSLTLQNEDINNLSEGGRQYVLGFVDGLIKESAVQKPKVQQYVYDWFTGQFGLPRNDLSYIVPSQISNIGTGGAGGSKKDAIAELWKKRAEEIEKAVKMYDQWKKVEGKLLAENRVKYNEELANLFNGAYGFNLDLENPTEAYEYIQSLLDKSKEKQKELKINLGVKISDAELKDAQEEVKKFLDDMKEYAKKATSQWDLYKQIFEATGDKSFAMKAFDNTQVWDEAAKQMKDKLQKELGEDFEIDFTISEAKAKEVFEGKDSLFELWKAIKDRIEKKGIDVKINAAKAIQDTQSINDKIKSLENQRDEELKDYTEGTPEYDAIAKRYENQIVALRGELFELSPAFKELFVDTTGMASGKVFELWQRAKSLVDLIRQNTTRTVKNANGEVTGRYYKDADGNEQYVSEQSLKDVEGVVNKLGKKVSQTQTAFDRLWKSIKGKGEEGYKFADIATDISILAEATAQASQELSSMFDSLGNEDLADAFSFAGDMLNGVSTLGKAAASFASGDVLGGIYGSISGVTGIIGSIAAMHDKKLDKSIKKSQLEVQKLENAYSNIESVTERQLGSLTSSQAAKMIENLNKQRSELAKQYDLEDDKKKTDKSKLEDYKQQISELDEQIKYFYEDWANEQYGVDIKGWASQIAESLTEAFSTGEDAAKAFDNTVGDILQSLATEAIRLQFIEPAMENLRNYMFGDGGIFTIGSDKGLDVSESEMAGLGAELEKLKGQIESSNEFWDKINDAVGGILNETESSEKGGLSKGIQSVTEDTADLLASYLNDIRANVSVDRNLLEKLIGEDVPRLSYIAEAQLRELNQIVANTKRNADAADKIYDLVNRVVDKGSNKLKV